MNYFIWYSIFALTCINYFLLRKYNSFLLLFPSIIILVLMLFDYYKLKEKESSK